MSRQPPGPTDWLFGFGNVIVKPKLCLVVALLLCWWVICTRRASTEDPAKGMQTTEAARESLRALEQKIAAAVEKARQPPPSKSDRPSYSWRDSAMTKLGQREVP